MTATTRVDLYTPIHKGIRGLLFRLAAAAARLDGERADAADAMVGEVERAIGFLDEHAALEDQHLLPVLRGAAPTVEAALAADHRALDALQQEVAAAAYALAAAGGRAAAAHLCRLVNRLTAGHLAHMDREEGEANQALWAALDDLQLMALRARMSGSLPASRRAEWLALIVPQLSPFEERLMAAAAPPAERRDG